MKDAILSFVGDHPSLIIGVMVALVVGLVATIASCNGYLSIPAITKKSISLGNDDDIETLIDDIHKAQQND